MNLCNSFFHSLHLRLAQRLGQGVNLAIDIRFGNMVKIDQRDFAHATAGQGFCSP